MEKEIFSTMGDRIKYLRGLRGLSSRQLAKRLCIRPATLTSIENSTSKSIRPSTMNSLIQVFHEEGIVCEPCWIFEGKGITPSIKGSKISNTYANINKFINFFNDYNSFYISFIDRDEKFVAVNDIYKEIFDCSIENIVNRSLKEMIGEKGYSIVSPYAKKALNGKEVSFFYTWYHNNLKPRSLSLNFKPLKDDEENEVIGFLSIMQDVEIPNANKINLLGTYFDNNQEQFNKVLYLQIYDMVDKIFNELKINKTFNITKIVEMAYLYFYPNRIPTEIYIKELIDLALSKDLLESASD